ncbi:MAG: NAD(P)H-hydrate dehydratase [Parachlamydiales bacterium]|nr:NAD(P)H-hydrate dehydratase [Parachlamydiales bacterium]
MLKVVLPETMSTIENQAQSAGSDPAVFMENAGLHCAYFLRDWQKDHENVKTFHVLLGKGNNAGDALVCALHLKKMGFTIKAYALYEFDECSELCQNHWKSFKESGGEILKIRSKADLNFSYDGAIIDGIFGTGFTNNVTGLSLEAIIVANSCNLPIISIDIPSGLNGSNGEPSPIAIRADATLSLGMAKLGYFIGSGWNHVGKIVHIDFGLPQDIINKEDGMLHMVEEHYAAQLLPSIQRNRHKYQAGYVLGVAGSQNMPGAGGLSSMAALKGGAGMVRLGFFKEHKNLLSHLAWEIIPEPIEHAADLANLMQKVTSFYCGPGIGRGEKEKVLVNQLLSKIKSAYVLDADALYFVSQDDTLVLPPLGVLTPHTGEMSQLLDIKLGKDPLNWPFLRAVDQYAAEKNVTVVLKGAPSFVFHPNKTPVVIPTGDPGMATAGSGDVLTGLIASLLAQNLTPHDAAILGAYIHGLAGMHAAKIKTSYSMTAKDILESISCAFKTLLKSST